MAAELFVSYTRKDRERVLSWVQELQAQGVSVWMDEAGLDGAVIWQQEIVEAIDRCKLLLLLLSPSAVDSSNIQREVTLALEGNKPILPLLLEPVSIPPSLRYQLAGIQQIELFTGDRQQKFQAIMRSLQRWEVGGSGSGAIPEPPPHARVPCPATSVDPAPAAGPTEAGLRVALLYKRHAEPDERLLRLLEPALTAQGHQVFVDRHLSVGVEWAKEIERQVRSADAVIPLLSAASVQSEMLAYEIQTARDAAHEQQGKPRLLPVRVCFADRLPEPLAAILSPLQYATWERPEDDEPLVTELLDALRRPAAPAVAREKLEAAGGVVPWTHGSMSSGRPTRSSVWRLPGKRALSW